MVDRRYVCCEESSTFLLCYAYPASSGVSPRKLVSKQIVDLELPTASLEMCGFPRRKKNVRQPEVYEFLALADCAYPLLLTILYV